MLMLQILSAELATQRRRSEGLGLCGTWPFDEELDGAGPGPVCYEASMGSKYADGQHPLTRIWHSDFSSSWLQDGTLS